MRPARPGFAVADERPAPGAPAPRYRARTATMIAMAAIAFAGYALAAPRSLSGTQTFDSPRENIGYVLTDRLVSGDGWGIPLRHADDLPGDIARALAPRDGAVVDGRVYPQDFAGSVVLFLLVAWLWKPLVLLIVPALAVVSAFVLVQLLAELRDVPPGSTRRSWRRPATRTDAWIGVALFTLWLAHPGMIVTGSMIFDSAIAGMLLLLVGVLFFVRFWRDDRTRDFAVAVAAFAAATIVRYPNVIFVLPIAVAVLAGRRLNARRAAVAVVIALPFAAVVLVFNALTYGSPLTTGYHVTGELLRQTANFSGDVFAKLRPLAVRNHLLFYVALLPAMMMPALIGLAGGGRRLVRRRETRGAAVAILLASILYTLYHLGLDTWGSGTLAVNASFIRYALPAIALWLLLLVEAVTRAGPPSRTSTALVALLVVVSIGTAIAGPVGVAYRNLAIERHQALLAMVEATTPPDALVMARVSDRTLFPSRQTITLTYLLDNDEPVAKTGDTNVWEFLPTGARLADVAARIVRRGIPLFLVWDVSEEQMAEYRAALRARGLSLVTRGRLPGDAPDLLEVVRDGSA